MDILNDDIQALSKTLVDEIFKALGLSPSGWARRTFGLAFARVADRFASIGIHFDRYVEQFGFSKAAQWILPYFVKDVQAHGVEHVPQQGPLLVVSNHPGVYDALVIASNLCRNDIKIVVGDIPFLGGLPRTREHFLFAISDLHARMNVVRTAIRHLLDDGALLIFPSGHIDPDPAVWPDAHKHLEQWSRSVEILLRKVPQTQVLVSIVSGVLSERWARSPITWLRKEDLDRRRLAEFGQVSQQLLFPGRLLLSPNVSFAPPLTTADLGGVEASGSLLRPLIEEARGLLAEHLAR